MNNFGSIRFETELQAIDHRCEKHKFRQFHYRKCHTNSNTDFIFIQASVKNDIHCEIENGLIQIIHRMVAIKRKTVLIYSPLGFTQIMKIFQVC